jgi:hypothetical protein
MNFISRSLAFSLLALEILQPQAIAQVRTTWVGNTFGGIGHVHVQNQVAAMTVAADGTVYTDSGWDENGSEAGIYKNGAWIGAYPDLHGFGRDGGSAIAVDNDYAYVAMVQSGDDGANSNFNANGLEMYPPRKHLWYCIRRYHLGGDPAPFPAGYGIDGSMLKVNDITRIKGTVHPDGSVHGLAVANGQLYASDPANGRILVYSTEDLSLAATWPCAGCQSLTVDAQNNVWVCVSSGPKVVEFGPDGTLKATTITLNSTSVPSAIVYRAKDNSLYVVDRGPDQNIKIYAIANLSGSPTKPSATIGTTGGIFAGSGTTIGTAGPLRFNEPSGVGFDNSGNIYVASTGSCSGGGSVIESYAPDGKRNWVLYGLEFVDTAEPDPLSENDVYTVEEHFVMDYSATAPGGEWSYKGYTIDPFKYPDDPRRHIPMSVAWVRRIDGHRFLFTSNMMASVLAVNRFAPDTDGEIGIPSVLFGRNNPQNKKPWPANQPADAGWIWRDSNGNGTQDADEYSALGTNIRIGGWGLWPDSKGDVWQCSHFGIRHFICQGLDGKGNPIYDYAAGHCVTVPPPPLPNGVTWKDVLRIRYFPTAQDAIPADTMFVSGYTSQWPDNTAHWWGMAGRVVYRFDNWSTHPTIHTGYPIVLPSETGVTQATETAILGIDVCGKYVFAGESRNPQMITVYDNDTGKQVTTMVPGDAVGGPGSTGWLDIREPIHVYKRSNDEYLIFVEEDWKAKVLLYRWIPKG